MSKNVAAVGIILASALLVTACMTSPGHDRASGPSSGDPDLITRPEIDRGQWADLYDLVRNLRPRWLQPRGTDSFANPGEVQVYIDGTRLGGVDLLRGISTSAVDRLEWVDPISASGRWGLDHAHGVIAIFYSSR